MRISTSHPIGEALSRGDWEFIRTTINKRFGCDIGLVETRTVITRALSQLNISDKPFGHEWSGSTWMVWLKNRLEFSHGRNYSGQHDGYFFTTVPEDMKMIGRLHEDGCILASRLEINRLRLANISPINRTAWLVSTRR